VDGVLLASERAGAGATAEEAVNALVALGYNAAEASNAVRKALDESGRLMGIELIKAALGKVTKGNHFGFAVFLGRVRTKVGRFAAFPALRNGCQSAVYVLDGSSYHRSTAKSLFTVPRAGRNLFSSFDGAVAACSSPLARHWVTNPVRPLLVILHCNRR
jgi:hypothetical protein